MKILLSSLVLLSLFVHFSLAHAEKLTPEQKRWKRAGFSNPIISTLTPPAVAATHVLDVTIVMFRNTGWTKPVLEAHLKRTNEIYAQCGIQLGVIQLVESDPYLDKLDINERWSSLGDDYAISKATPLDQRPVVYLMRNILPGQSGSREGAFTNIENFWVPLEPVMQNTIWISNVINDENYGNYRDMSEDGKSILKFRDPGYNVVAHEFAHLLANMGHETGLREKNLLNGSSDSLNDHLLPRQCEKFKNSPLIRKP